MDLPGAAAEIAKLKGQLKQLRDEDRQVLKLVTFVCIVLCKQKPELREPLLEAIHERVDEEFDDAASQERAKTLYTGLEEVRKALEDPANQ